MNDGVHYTQSFQNGIDRLFGLIPQIIGVYFIDFNWLIFCLDRKTPCPGYTKKTSIRARYYA
jgi:hypothetical protein